MNKNSLLFLFLSLILIPSAFARKPAVEDFVGVEHEGFVESPQGTDVLFEFGNTVKAVKTVDTAKMSKSSGTWSELTPIFVLVSFLLLPFAIWSAINRSVNKLETDSGSAENVASLSDYKKESALTDEETPSDDYEQAS